MSVSNKIINIINSLDLVPFIQLKRTGIFFSRPHETFTKKLIMDFPGGPVVKNPPANAGETGLILGPGRSHMPWGN